MLSFLQVNFPLCTLAHTPRLPEHCIEYVRLLLWPKDNPFGGDDVAIDGDDPAHITWIFEKSTERGLHYGIQGVTYRYLTSLLYLNSPLSFDKSLCRSCVGGKN